MMQMCCSLVGSAPAPRRRCCLRRSRPARSLSVLLFYLAPLPILIAAIGWSHWAGADRGRRRARSASPSCSARASSSRSCVGVGAAGLVARLSRVAGAAGRDRGNAATLEWYPVGRLVFWAAILGALIVIAAHARFRHRRESFRAGAAQRPRAHRCAQDGDAGRQPLELPGVADADRAHRFPGGRRCRRPPRCSPPSPTCSISGSPRASSKSPAGCAGRGRLAAMRFPRSLPGTARARRGRAFLPRPPRPRRRLVLGRSLLMAYGVLGFAVLHAITRGMNSRRFLLGGIYAAVLVLRLAGAGAVPARARPTRAFDFRGRVAARAGRRRPHVTTSNDNLQRFRSRRTTMEVICSNASASSARWATSCASRTALPAISCCRKARRCAPPRTTRRKFEAMKVELEARNLEHKGEADKVGDKLDGQSFVVLRQASRNRPALRLGVAARHRRAAQPRAASRSTAARSRSTRRSRRSACTRCRSRCIRRSRSRSRSTSRAAPTRPSGSRAART